MTHPRWIEKVDAARSEDEILAILRQYLRAWSSTDVAQLPEGCRPAHLVDGEDVARWAYILAAADCGQLGGGERSAILTRIANLFAQANGRIAMLAAQRRLQELSDSQRAS
jgi:hypothetical protein